MRNNTGVINNKADNWIIMAEIMNIKENVYDKGF